MGTYVRPEGDPQTARLIIVGDQPDKTEIQNGRPFIGPAGRELNECLKAVGITRSDCYLTNFVKDLDAPIEQYLNVKKGTYSEKGLEYQRLLLGELRSSKADVIIAMGQFAMVAITGILESGITKWRGSVLTVDSLPGKWIIPTIHTDTILPPKFQYLNKFLIQLDLKKAKQIVDNGFQRTARTLQIKPTFQEAMLYLDRVYNNTYSDEIVYFDIEIYNEEVSCISFSKGPDFAISIPFVGWNGDYFTAEEETTIWWRIADILENQNICKCGQNLSFDAHFLLRKYGIKTCNIEDTMVAQHTIMPDYPKGLDFITSVWTDQPYYKDEGKKYFSGGGWEQLWKYNATDSIICAEAFPKQVVKLREGGNYETYKEQCRLIPPLVYMQERGIKVDIEGMIKEAAKLESEIGPLQEQLNQAAGQLLNPNSPKQLKDYFYGVKHFHPYKSRITGEVTTDEQAMKRIARQGCKEAQIILDIRKRKKMISTYLNPEKIDKDSRIRCSYNPVGTRYSRLSSSSNIFGTGMNMQNWSHSTQRFLLFDDGYVGYRLDLSQAENRIVAYEGNITPMIDCFEREDDVHSLTAALIFNKDPKEVTREDGTCFLGDGSHSERFWGKKANHGLNYDLGYKAFALIYEMPEKQALFIVNRYHQAYPGVRNNYHANVRASLKRDRTVTNLMGRRTLFMDQWEDSLFKEAYSCIPQGTVGDIVNKRGMNYIYYNKCFDPVELLLQVHDDITFQIPLSIGLHKHAELLLAIKASLELPLTTSYGREFIIPVDITVCPKTFDKEHGATDIKGRKCPTTAAGLEKLLTEILAK